MSSPLGCKSFNYLPKESSQNRDPDSAVTYNCEFSPNSAAVPDHTDDDGHRGFDYVVKFVGGEDGVTPQQGYCGGPYRSHGVAYTEKDLAACKTHCTALGDSCREFRWHENGIAEGAPGDDGDGTCYVWTGTCELIQEMIPDTSEGAAAGAMVAKEVGVIYYKRDVSVLRLTPSSQWDYYQALFTPAREWGRFEASGPVRSHIGGYLASPGSNRDYDVKETDGGYCVVALDNGASPVAQDGKQDELYKAGLWPWTQAECIADSVDDEWTFAERCIPLQWQSPDEAARCRAYNSYRTPGAAGIRAENTAYAAATVQAKQGCDIDANC